MRHEKIIENEVKNQEIKIEVEAYLHQTETSYEIDVYSRNKNARKWIPVVDRNDYDYRKMSSAGKATFENEINLTFVSAPEILEAKMELWEKMKPE